MTENRHPMHARGPPRKVIMLLQTPGMVRTDSGRLSHRSGLYTYGIRSVAIDGDLPMSGVEYAPEL